MKALVNNINKHTILLNTLTAQVMTQSDRVASLVAKTDACMDCIVTHQDSLVDMANVVHCNDSCLDAMASLHDCFDSHLQQNDHPAVDLSAQLNNHAQQVHLVLDPLGQSVDRMEKYLHTLMSLDSDAGAHATASHVTTMAHDNAQHPTILESMDEDHVNHDLPSQTSGVSAPRPGSVLALPAQRWTGVDPSLFGPKRITPQLGDDASSTPTCTMPPLGVDASGPQQQSTSEEQLGSNRPTPLKVHGDPNDGSVGGPVCSPSMVDRDRLARECKSSHLNILKLASGPYHVGYDGVRHLTEKIIFNCGLTKATGHMDNASFCFQDIFCVHKKVYDGWYDPQRNSFGPNVTYIVEKALTLFPRLTIIMMEATVKFYNDLQSTGINYLLPLMPFDAIYIPYGFEALCPPGLGTGRYAEVSYAFMELFTRLLPVTTYPRVSAIVDAVGMESNNGYDLLFHILVLTVPGFDPTLPLLAEYLL